MSLISGGRQRQDFVRVCYQQTIETIVVGHVDEGSLLVETFDHFTDGSGRSNYYSRYLGRDGVAVMPIDPGGLGLETAQHVVEGAILHH